MRMQAVCTELVARSCGSTRCRRIRLSKPQVSERVIATVAAVKAATCCRRLAPPLDYRQLERRARPRPLRRAAVRRRSTPGSADRVAPLVDALEDRDGLLDLEDRDEVEVEERRERGDALGQGGGIVGLDDRDPPLA